MRRSARCGEVLRNAAGRRARRALRAAGAGRGDGVLAEARRDEHDHGAEQNEAHREHGGERGGVAEHGARRPPHDAADAGQARQHAVGLQEVAARRQRAVGHDRRDLQADDEGGADHRGDDLRDEARALRAEDAKQRDGERDRERRRGRAHGEDHRVGAEPARAAAHDQNIDERRGERQRHRRDRERDGRDAHGEDFLRRDRRGENEIEIGARIEGARHRLHRLRDHQEPGQAAAWSVMPTSKCLSTGATAKSPTTAQATSMHENDEAGDADRDAAAALRLAGRHHRQPLAPGEPRLVAGEPDDGAGAGHRCAFILPRSAAEVDHAKHGARRQVSVERESTSTHRLAALATSPARGGGHICIAPSRRFRRFGDERQERVLEARAAGVGDA